MLDEKWRNAMRQEIDALDENGTWTIETLPSGKKAIGCKWVFRLKFKADGTLERYKARLVVLGNNQVEGTDFTDTFAPVIKMTTVRTLFVHVCSWYTKNLCTGLRRRSHSLCGFIGIT